MYTGWYDPDKKKSDQDKLRDAAERYRRRWGREPRVALVNVASSASSELTIEVRRVGHVAPNTFFVGEDEPV